MPASSVKISVEEKTKQQLADLKKRYEAASKQIRQMNDPHARIAAFLDGWVQRNFKTEGKKVGGWKPFKAGGRRLKNGSFDGSAKLLQDTGRLKFSFIPFHNKKDAGIGSDLPYSEFHEKGKGVPKRRMLPVFGEVKSDIDKIYKGFVNEVVDKNKIGDGKVK